MYRATLPIIFIIYLALFFIAFNPMKEKRLPIFDFSLFVMILIFWASFFVLKKNIFEPLINVLKERDKFIKEREEKYEEALFLLKKNQEEYDREISHFREKERQNFIEFTKKLKEEKNKEIEDFKNELNEKLKLAIKKFQKEKEEAKSIIDKKVRAYSIKLSERILKKNVH